MNRRDWLKALLVGSVAAVLPLPSFLQKKRSFDSIAFPLIRKVAPVINPSELVRVQPMSLPTSCTFFLDYRYVEEYIVPKVRKDISCLSCYE
jgi:hypothetical protein